jgi:NADPH2:quinone reductase
MRAVRLHDHKHPPRVEMIEEPVPRDGEVLVEIEFAGVNPIERYAAEGLVAPDGPLPRTLGGEAAGTLDGNPVLVTGGGLGMSRDGLWAEQAAVPRTSVFELPDGVSAREAAAMGIAGLTAWMCTHELARVGPEDRVLVLGASGGVGSMIVSLTRAAGATVWGQTGSGEKTSMIDGQGADRSLVASEGDLAEAVAEFQPTVVFDPLGDGYVGPSLEVMAPHGRYVVFGTSAGARVELNMQTLYRNGITVFGYAGGRISEDQRRHGLSMALRALQARELRVVVDQVLPLEQAQEAFERLVERRVKGKILLATS